MGQKGNHLREEWKTDRKKLIGVFRDLERLLMREPKIEKLMGRALAPHA